MFQRRLLAGIVPFIALLFMLVAPLTAFAATLDVTDIRVSVQADDAVKARDTAIIQAQRQAFAVLTGVPVDSITDAQIARLVSGFSVRSEKVLSRSYAALFTVRFNSVSTQNFNRLNNLPINPNALAGRPISASGTDNTVITQQTAQPESGMLEVPETSDAIQTADSARQNILVLPILDIGARRIVWDEPNPWREVWQRKDHSIHHMPVRVPLGDISDISDIPDAQFLAGGQANIVSLMDRYQANRLYVVVAKNQGAALDPSGGMALSLYKHDGRKLQFVRKTVMRPRPGYAFDDAVPAAIQMIVLADNRHVDDVDDIGEPTYGGNLDLGDLSEHNTVSVPPTAQSETVQTITTFNNNPIVVTVPYQSLSQWVGIQKRLRQVQGIMNIIPSRVSPSSARLQIITNIPTTILATNLAKKGFDLKRLPGGEIALVERSL